MIPTDWTGDWNRSQGKLPTSPIIQDCYAKRTDPHPRRRPHRHLRQRQLADRMAMLAAQRKEKELRLYQEEIDILALLKIRAGDQESVFLELKTYALKNRELAQKSEA